MRPTSLEPLRDCQVARVWRENATTWHRTNASGRLNAYITVIVVEKGRGR